MTTGALFLAVFLACLVEAVEALTIVLAAGIARDWRSAGLGVLGGLAMLTVAVGVAGPALTAIPLDVLRIVIGGLLLIFGLQWVRKAVLRASGRKALHDEATIFRSQLAAAAAAPSQRRVVVGDWYAFTLSFKGVLLEGLEVVFIVLTFGSNQHNVPLAALAAGCAVALVAVAGFAVRSPLQRVPENALKLVVGILLTSFGIFWGGEGAGAHWPGSDAALLVIVPAVAFFTLVLTVALRGNLGSAAHALLGPIHIGGPS
ncbi:MAG: COG4280 domain-containing protein [Nocardioidaceae bacterium]